MTIPESRVKSIISQQVDKLITNFSDVDILVVDGLYAIKCKAVDIKVFIDLTYHETKMEQAVRGKEVMDEFRAQVLEMENIHGIGIYPWRSGQWSSVAVRDICEDPA